MSATYTYWQDPKDGMWLGYWNDYPDHMTEGYTHEDLKDMLRDLREIILSGDLGDVPHRNVGTILFA